MYVVTRASRPRIKKRGRDARVTLRLAPAFSADEFDKSAGDDVGGAQVVSGATHFDEHLLIVRADGEDGDPVFGQLGHKQLARQLGRAGGDENPIERSRLFPA